MIRYKYITHMSIPDAMEERQNEHPNTPESSPNSSDSEGLFIESDTMLRTVNEPDVSLDEMLSLACRQGKLDIVQLLLQSGAQVNHRNKAGNTPLLEACSQGHVLVANYLLENGSKIDTPTETTLDSALTWACTLGNSIIVEALLHKHADVEHRTKDGCTALMFACLAGHRDVAEKLLDANSEVNVESDSNKDSPLTFACWKGHQDVVTLLLQRNANIEHRTKEGFSPLMFAALGGHTNVARKLLEHNAQVNVSSGSNNDIPLTSACWKGHSDVVNLLLEFNSNIEHRTKDGCTPLMLAAREGHISVAELLLKNKSQVNVPSGSENNIPLTLACWKGHCEVVKLLLEYGSDIEHRNKAGCTPLMLAAREGHFKTTALLLSHCAQVNIPSGSNDDTPLTLACWKGHKNVLLLLLQSKSNIDHQTKTGCTPLMEATREGHKDVAEILLNHNAGVEIPDNYGQSPLFMACWKGHRDVAELLLQRNAYRDCRTKTGITPLFQACRENHVAIVELLIEYGAGVNTPFPNSRENPMTLCAEKGHKILVELLLSRNASHDCRTKKGCTPLLLACKEGHIEIAKILANQGASLETADCRNNTPIMAAYKNGHVAVVDWLIKSVNHLPSDELTHKILMSSVDEKQKEVIVQKRSKCLNIIQEAKRKRELLALKNAQSLVQELDDEKTREEKKKTRKKEKRRDKRNKRKKVARNDTDETEEMLNGVNHNVLNIEDEEEEEEIKDHVVPTENRQNNEEDDLTPSYNQQDEVLKISTIPSIGSRDIDLATTKGTSSRKTRKKLSHSDKTKDNQNSSKKPIDNSTLKLKLMELTVEEPTNTNKPNGFSTTSLYTNKQSSHGINVVELLTNQLNKVSIATAVDLQRQLPKTTGVCTKSTSTSGSSRSLTSSSLQQANMSSTVASTSMYIGSNKVSNLPIVSSIAATTSLSMTTSQADPRSDVSYITPTEYNSEGWDDDGNTVEKSCVATYSRSDSSTSSVVSRTDSFDEYKEMDWKEITRNSKSLVYELTVPNSYCGRVIGKGGKKINLITDESGAQITIDKPPANIVPADRVITIKGAPNCVERACALVTKALNTPSLNNRLYDGLPMDVEVKPVVPTTTVNSTVAVQNMTPRVTAPTPVSKKRTHNAGTKSIASAEVSVTPLVTYTQVAAGAVSLENIQKQLQSKKNDQELSSTAIERSSPNVTDQSNEENALPSSPSPTKEFSYFSEVGKLYNEGSKSQEETLNLQSNGKDESSKDETTFDRNRSVSWTGNPKVLTSHLTEVNAANRCHSTEAIHYRCEGTTSPPGSYNTATGTSNSDELSDEHVFVQDDSLWPVRDVTNTSSTGECWEGQSSSPTSSVSSSKIELANILNDNDSGVGGSNPLAPTPDESESRISYQDVPYLETALEGTPWLQSRGAYSAPSSPALQRNTDNNITRSTQENLNIRGQLSMENLNYNRGWVKNERNSYSPWGDRKVPSPASFNRVANSPDNSRDSALSSPHLPLNPSQELDVKKSLNNTGGGGTKSMNNTGGGGTKPWSAERFQDVHTVSDLLSQLSLDKYNTKLQENGVTLEAIVKLTEKDLQMYDIPKGPRLKILKACEVIKGRPFNSNSTNHVHQANLTHQSNHLINNDVNSFFQSLPRNYQPPLQDKFAKDHLFSSSMPYMKASYQMQAQPPYNVVIPNNQQFIYPPSMQHQPPPPSLIQRSVFNAAEEYQQHSVPSINPLLHNQPVYSSQPAYIYPENQTCYYYTQPQ